MHTLTIAIPTYNRDKILSENIGVLEKIVTTAYGQIQTLALRYPTVKFVVAI